MEKRHLDQMLARLDQLYVNGSTFISWGEIYHWYNVERISKKPWRDIQEQWEELLRQKAQKYVDPQVSSRQGGITLFFSDSPEKLSALAK